MLELPVAMEKTNARRFNYANVGEGFTIPIRLTAFGVAAKINGQTGLKAHWNVIDGWRGNTYRSVGF